MNSITEVNQAIKNGVIKMSRKPGNLMELTTTSFRNLSDDLKEALTKLPEYDYTDDYPENGFFADVLDGDQQFYTITIDEDLFFVDTQGFNYPRYVTRLVDVNLQIQ